MTDEEIKNLVADEIRRHFARLPRIIAERPQVFKVPAFSEVMKIEHKPITSNQPDKK